MRHGLSTLLLCAVLAAPASAQEEGTPGEGLDLLREGSRLILEGLLDEMRPMLDQARPLLEEELLPFLENLGALVDDLTSYEPPERLPNGDIIIRRRPDAPPLEDLPEVGEDGAVEL